MVCARIVWVVFLPASALFSSCSAGPQKTAVIGEAYAGPAALNLHQDIDSKSATVAVAHHGERLDIVAQRRRWYKVRTAKGIEGWTSDRELLDTAQMSRLRALAAQTAGLPSQGKATTFGALNVHTEPNRQSASFLQIREKEIFDVIAHRVAERIPLPKRQLIAPPPKVEKKKNKEKVSKIPLPPPPAPPEPPPDWLDLSKAPSADEAAEIAPVEPEPAPGPAAPPQAKDDWTLIRTASGQSGWVLTSGTYMQIPDEVAQYAEGHRITSYFSIGKVRDGDEQKDIWLWTTADRLGEDHDFDGYRVFTWSLRRHRYETGYIQRRQRGFFPVLAKTGEFAVCLEQNDGSLIRKQYILNGNAVRLSGQSPCAKMVWTDEYSVQTTQPETKELVARKSIADRMKQRVKGIFGR